MKEVYLYKKLDDGGTECLNCAYYCRISEGQKGVCRVRENIKGKLYALNYAKAIAVETDPVEKKPLYHFLPGTQTLSLATVGCNFQCDSCQNWEISQMPRLTKEIAGQEIKPEALLREAKENGLPSISYTYTEPAIFSEYALDTMKPAKKEGIKNIWVSNGFWSKELFEMIAPYLDAANIDLKGFSEETYANSCKGGLQPVLDTMKRIKEKNIWLEVTTLVIPGVNDKAETFRETAEFIKRDLGEETPWHLSRFSGAVSWKLKTVPDTPEKTLNDARQIGLNEGLKYVYVGNIPETDYDDTYCPRCQTMVIKRRGYLTERLDEDGFCPKCGEKIDLVLK